MSSDPFKKIQKNQKMTKKTLLLLLLLLLSKTAFALETGKDGFPHLVWTQVDTDLSFPGTVSSAKMAVSTTDDFMALVQDQDGVESLYFFDHNQESWVQKKQPQYSDVASLEFGLGKFFLFQTKFSSEEDAPYFGYSSDGGVTWNPSLFSAVKPHCNHVTFSEDLGVAMNDQGEVATTKDGATWTESSKINFSAHNILRYCSRTTSGTDDDIAGKFVVLENHLEKTEHYFLKTDDFLTQKPLLSNDGATWNPSEKPLDLMTLLSGQSFDKNGQILDYDSKIFYGSKTSYSTAPFDKGSFDPKTLSPISKDDAPSFEVLDYLFAKGWFVVAGTLTYKGSKKAVAAYSPNAGGADPSSLNFFIVDSIGNDPEDTIVAMKANSEGVLAITNKGHSFFASLANPTAPVAKGN
ncbi:MAG: hypothetical protein ACOYK6_07645 [Chthoniobacterales bacterium]